MAILAVVLCFTLAACGDKTNVDDEVMDATNDVVDATQGEDATDATDEAAPAVVEDLARIKEAGKLVVGMTIYEPMNYYADEAKTELTGFDTEFALAVAEKLGVEVEFIEINWDRKFEELDAKTIDCVWNGMTITEEALANASVSDPYIKNAQVLVMKASKIADYTDADSIKVKVSTGNVTGTLTSDKIFNYSTGTGKVELPSSTSGGLCEITTSTGDIRIEISPASN